MVFPIFSAIATAVKFVFASQSLIASGLRFIGGTIVSQLLSGQTKTEGPRLSDLRVQVSTYGNSIPRLYGSEVRVTGNVIDKSDLNETRKRKKKKFLGITVASQTTYTYDVDLVILLADGEYVQGGLTRIIAQGKTIFDRDAGGGGSLSNGGTKWVKSVDSGFLFDSVTYYHGSATQSIDPVVQALHPGQPVPAYRHSAYVVIEGLQLADWGNGVPNLEFFVETPYTTVRQCVEHLASFADVTVNGFRLRRQALRGYVVARAGSVWSAIEPLAGTFDFDLVTDGADFRAVTRGGPMRTVLAEEDFAARTAVGNPENVAEYTRDDPNTFPDEVTVTYMDIDRDHQPNTQRAQRNQGYAKNKVDIELPIVLSADEARQVAGRALAESIAAAGGVKYRVSGKYRWLEGSNIVGIPIDGEVEPFRIFSVTESTNGIVEIEGAYEDVLSYTGDIPGTSGAFTPAALEVPGDSLFQPIDGGILEDADDDAGFYFAVGRDSAGWRGADIYRAFGVGSPLAFDLMTDIVVAATIADCVDTLPAGPTDVVDYVSTLQVQILGPDTLESVDEADMIERNLNLAWVGNQDGGGGEYINFTSAQLTGSPGIYTLSGLLRGRRGTEHAVATHGPGERLVLMNSSDVSRFDFGTGDWNAARTYMAASIPFETGDEMSFTNTGEGKRPYSGVHLNGVRNGSNDDILITWERRTRFETPALGGGPVPLGEETEAYEIDITDGGSPGVVVRTLTSSTTSVNYTTAMQTADGHTPGAPVTVRIYQMSTSRGRGHVLEGTA